MLSVRGLETCYGVSQVLFGLALDVSKGEVVTLLGRNGMGKTTTMNSIMGIVRPRSGSILFDDHEVTRLPSFRTAKLGLGLVPEGRQVFPALTVCENLVATASRRNAGANPWTLDRVQQLFPRLQERSNQISGQLSGGEQQMLAIGRALMTNPKLLILDEATEGLAPLIRLEIWRCLEQLKGEGMSMIVVDKNLKSLLPLASRHYIVEKGRIFWSGDSAALEANREVHERYLGI